MGEARDAGVINKILFDFIRIIWYPDIRAASSRSPQPHIGTIRKGDP
jgi:hypothetical protein